MKIIIVLFLLFPVISFAQNNTNAANDSTTVTNDTISPTSLLKAKKYTRDFYKYDNNYSFKGIKLGAPLSTLMKIAKLKRTEYSNMFEIGNSSFLTYSNFAFDEGAMFFTKGRLISVQLSSKSNPNKFDEMFKHFANLFGIPSIHIIVKNRSYIWTGHKISISLAESSNSKENSFKIFLEIFSLQIKTDKIENM